MVSFFYFFAFYSFFWVIWIGGFVLFRRETSETKEVQSFLRFYTQILIFPICIRILAFATEPVYDDDWARFLWEGKVFSDLGTPYTTKPMDWFGRNLEGREEEILSYVNHPDYPTIYFPVFQFFFLAAYKIAGLNLWGLRLLYLFFDFGILFFLLRFSRPENAKKQIGFLWGVAPLWIWEFYIHLHPDLIGIFFLLGGYFFFRRGHVLGAGTFWALSLSTKPILPFLAFLLFLWDFKISKQNDSGMKKYFSVFSISALGFLLTWLPFWKEGWDAFGLFQFFSEFEFNSSVFALLQFLSPKSPHAWSFVFWILFVCISLLLFQEEASFLTSGLASLFLFSPVANPWYLLWCYPFLYLSLVTTNSKSALQVLWVIVWSLTIFLAYATGKILGDPNLTVYGHPLWARLLEFLPLFGAFLFSCFFQVLQQESIAFHDKNSSQD